MLASFGQGSNSIKSAEQGAGLGLPIAKSLVDLHGGTFVLKSKLRIGTEVVVTFPPERVVAAMAPMTEITRRRSRRRRASRSSRPRKSAGSAAGRCSGPGLNAEPCDNRAIAFPPAVLMVAANSAPRPTMIESPCVKICTLDARSGLCLGCGRTHRRDRALDRHERRRACRA